MEHQLRIIIVWKYFDLFYHGHFLLLTAMSTTTVSRHAGNPFSTGTAAWGPANTSGWLTGGVLPQLRFSHRKMRDR
jgi:hypothetical protein